MSVQCRPIRVPVTNLSVKPRRLTAAAKKKHGARPGARAMPRLKKKARRAISAARRAPKTKTKNISYQRFAPPIMKGTPKLKTENVKCCLPFGKRNVT